MLKPIAQREALKEKSAFREALCAWFEENGLHHPWRMTRDPWAVLVSEIMLQQTTVAAVKAGRRFERFLEEFPDVESISEAPEEQLLKAWEGLGYYNRVRNLQRTAQAVLAEREGVFPRSAEELEKLPGIGPYTAGAIASFAYNEAAAIVDGNVARVLTRIFDDSAAIDSTVGRQQLWEWARQLLSSHNARTYNSALMEVGQVFCRPKKPDCLACPIADFCQTREPEALPCKKKRTAMVAVTEHAIVAQQGGRLLLARESGSRRKGFYRLPLREVEEVADLALLQTSKYTITKHRVTLRLYAVPSEVMVREGEEWFSRQEWAALPMPSPVRRALEQVLGME